MSSHNGNAKLLVKCHMSPIYHKRTTCSAVPPTFYVAKNFAVRRLIAFFIKIFLFVCPIRLPIFFFSYYQFEPELGAENDSGMAFTPFPSSMLNEIRTHNLKIKSRVC